MQYFFNFLSRTFSIEFAVTVLPFVIFICFTGPLLLKKITYKTFSYRSCLFGNNKTSRISVAPIRLEDFRFGSKK